MQIALSGWKDTIVALATPPGLGAIGVIRLSGSLAIETVAACFSPKLLTAPSHTLHVGMFKDQETVLDEVVVALYRGPKSYTGEDVVEISAHGSPFVLEKIIEALVRRGIRLAKPGEFTQRAFLNGKKDLAQAEAVADLIASNTEASRRTALHHMKGGFSHDLSVLREELIRFSALIELELDFSQEDVAFADRKAFQDLIGQLQSATQTLLDSFRLGNVIKNGVQVAIIGAPNAGKSTLLNALLNENRAIVSDVAGTTRDTIEEVLNIEGVLFRLMDTAGIRTHTQDEIEAQGVVRSKEKMQTADLVLYLFDSANTLSADLSAALSELQAAQKPFLLVANKWDLCTAEQQHLWREQYPDTLLPVSAKNKEGLSVLRQNLLDRVVQGKLESESTIVTNARHQEALLRLSQSLQEVAQGLADGIPGDLLALDIRQCLHHLGTITGQITHEDQLDFIFSKFCIGK